MKDEGKAVIFLGVEGEDHCQRNKTKQRAKSGGGGGICLYVSFYTTGLSQVI